MRRIIWMLILCVIIVQGCGGSSDDPIQPFGSISSGKPFIESEILLAVGIKKQGDQLKIVKTNLKQSSSSITPYPSLSGDYGVFVIDQSDKLQYFTMFSFTGSDKALAEGTDPATGKRFATYVDISSLPNNFVLPVNEETKEIYVLDKNKKRVLDIPFDAYLLKSLPKKSSWLDGFSFVEELYAFYPNIVFYQYDATADIEYALYDEDIAQNLLLALSKFQDSNILTSIRGVFVVSNPIDIWLTVEGLHHDRQLFLVNKYVLGDHLPELIAHEGAHAYINFLEGLGTAPSIYYEDPYAGIIDGIAFYGSEWTEIKKEWYKLQQEYRETRSYNTCNTDDVFVASEYEYGQTVLPATPDKRPTVDGFFQHGFVSPYASSDVGEDIAETFTFALFNTQAFSRKVKQGNVFERKLSLLKDIGMISDSDYARLIPDSSDIQQYIVILEFRHKGVQYEPLYFVLNGFNVSPSFFDAGEYMNNIGDVKTWILDGQNELSLATVQDYNGDEDDIEVENLRLTSPVPVDPDTGCDDSIVYLDAPEPVHLGNDNCSADVFCPSYSPLRGVSYSWLF